METTPGMPNGGMGNPPIPSSPPVMPLNLYASIYKSWPKARWSMAKAVPLTRTTKGHNIRARIAADTKPNNTAGKRGNPGMCFKARAVP